MDVLRETYFQICWQQFGYGLNVTPAQCEEMPIEDLLWYRDRVNQQRERK
jgi:hypothetical protein